MSKTSVHLIYESGLGRPLTAARVDDRRLVKEVAAAAIREAYQQAETVGCVDQFVGEVQREEAARLERVLRKLVPELSEGEA